MSEIETLFGLRFTSPVLLAWPVMLYVFLVSLFVLMRRIMLCLLVTYLFTFYWAFSLHWGAFLASGVYSAAFAMYTICGLAIPGLIAMASYLSEDGDKRNRPASPGSAPETDGSMANSE